MSHMLLIFNVCNSNLLFTWTSSINNKVVFKDDSGTVDVAQLVQ